jgi:hypothetical protein
MAALLLFLSRLRPGQNGDDAHFSVYLDDAGGRPSFNGFAGNLVPLELMGMGYFAYRAGLDDALNVVNVEVPLPHAQDGMFGELNRPLLPQPFDSPEDSRFVLGIMKRNDLSHLVLRQRNVFDNISNRLAVKRTSEL